MFIKSAQLIFILIIIFLGKLQTDWNKLFNKALGLCKERKVTQQLIRTRKINVLYQRIRYLLKDGDS